MSRSWSALLLVTLVTVTAPARAEPYRLRGDAFAAARSPVGLLSLAGEDRTRPWLDAEALVWTGAGDENTADALVVMVRLRDPAGRGQARIGRMVLATGAIRPLHLDGVATLARLPRHTTVELFAGAPVAPRSADRPFDWVTGGRIAHSRRDLGTIGLSFYHQHDAGDLFDEEVGVDLAATPTRWLDLASRAAYDLVSPGISDAHLSAATRGRSLRLELYASRRSPSRMLPATSLFSVLGDIPSDELGASVRWNAAPRLDVYGSAAARAIGGAPGGALELRATLRLDDHGAGVVLVDAQRQDGPDAGWTGIRAALRLPITARIAASTELELVRPDHGDDRGALWPWALVALGWRSGLWESAIAIEASRSAEDRGALDALFRLSRSWEVTP